MSAIATPELVTVAPIQRPTFDNIQIASKRLWIDANANTLARYWRDQGQVLGLTTDDDTDFDFWLTVQWEIERGSL